NDHPTALLSTSEYENGRARANVTSGASAEIALQIILGADAQYCVPVLEIKDSVASISGPFVRQRSAGIEATFVLTFRRSFEGETGMMAIRVPPTSVNQ